MNKRLSFILVMLILSIVSYAMNQFVYVRYNPKEGNVSSIVKTIDRLFANSRGQVVVFISHAFEPLIATNPTEWEESRSKLLSMQTAYSYYPEEETAILNRYFVQWFAETIEPSLHIKGTADASWACTFIISDAMLHSQDFEFLAELIAINELSYRMTVDILTYNASQHLSTAEITNDTMFKFTNFE